MIYTLHPGAEQDVADALDFYSEHAGTAVAERFLNEFERLADLSVRSCLPKPRGNDKSLDRQASAPEAGLRRRQAID